MLDMWLHEFHYIYMGGFSRRLKEDMSSNDEERRQRWSLAFYSGGRISDMLNREILLECLCRCFVCVGGKLLSPSHGMAWRLAIKVGDAVGSVRQGFQVLGRAEETRAKPASCTPAPAGWEVGRIFSHL